MAKRELPLVVGRKPVMAEATRAGVTFQKKRGKEKITVDWLTIAKLAFGQGAVFNSRDRIKEMGF